MRFRLFLAVVFSTLIASPAALADAEAEIKYRQGVMKSVGGHMASMGTILRNRVHFEDFKLHAGAMADLATVVPKVFPEGSGDGETEALPVIWENPDEFQEKMDEFVSAADGIAEAANSGDMSAIGPAIQTLGQACKGCHDNFREE